MSAAKSKPGIVIRDLQSIDDLQRAQALECEVWGLPQSDATPLTLAIATREAGSIWLGAFDDKELIGFAFGFLGLERGQLTVHSHMLAVRGTYRDHDLGYKLKLAQRERALAMRIHEMTWTFDPLQSKNAHLNFAKLGGVSNSYKIDFYGPQTPSVLHRNSTDRLWVKWPLASRRVKERLQGKDLRPELLDSLATVAPLVRFNGNGKPALAELTAALSRQRVAIEVPTDIDSLDQKDFALAREWRQATRWAFTEALKQGFFVAEFCRTVRGQQGPGVYLLEKGAIEEYVPELQRAAVSH